jgi:AcrR family transcriptional regulator
MVKPALGPKRQRTRAVLIDAALSIIDEAGFEAVTLDAVAARVGMTKGAVYSNFRSKGQLLWEAARGRLTYVAPEFPPGAPLPEQAQAFARTLLAMVPHFEREQAFQQALLLHAQADPELQILRAASQAALFAAIDRYVETEFGGRLTAPTRTVTLAIQALVRGFLGEAMRAPDQVTNDVVATAFEGLIRGLTKPV